MLKRWNILPVQHAETQELQKALGSSYTVCALLVQRNILTYEQAKSFFNPLLEELHSPWLMKDMHQAVDRIYNAIVHHEKILIYGDYDVDGTTAVASMYLFLRKIVPELLLDFYIPNRYKEGYGISKIGIDHAHNHQFSLVISLDCGIKSVELIDYANTLGIDFIICDHHLPDDKLPAAVAILNPKQKDCAYPFKELCGCGVGFKLICALTERFNLPSYTPYELLDFNATAIAADIVPIIGENRILAFHGLKKINANPSVGIKAIMEVSKITPPLTIGNVVFMIAPRVNAAGRMDDARKAVLLFIASDPEQANQYAQMLQSDNTDRRDTDQLITQEALEIIQKDAAFHLKKSTVVYAEHWHKGVVGIVASRLIENHFRPTVVLTRNGNMITGSARSVPGFNLYEAIHACRAHLLAYGGHFAAAGLSLLPEKLKDFKLQFDEVVSAQIQPEQLIPEIIIDIILKPEDINYTLYKTISRMEPFGPENPKPVFMLKNITALNVSLLKEKHLRLQIKCGEEMIAAVGFFMENKLELINNNQPFDMAFHIEENVWNGNRSLQLKIIDIRKTEQPACTN